MVENPMFDIFLAHNTADKPKVRAIAEQLKRRGLKPWLDEEQIAPGRSFQEEIQKVIPLVQSAAIFIGLEGLGKWQVWELRSLIRQCVEKDIPIIPVLLPGVDGIPERFRFLKEFNWVSFEKIDDAAALYRLEWGITGIKPSVQSSKEEVKISANVTPNRSHSQAQYFTENLGKGITLDMVYIPVGTFMMGSPEGEGENNEKPQHEVTVQAFYMGKYPITQAQYQQVMGKNPSNFQGNERPVETVSWDDAVEFCQRLSQQTGTEYRLPSEAEWEYACRAGTTTKYYFGDDITSDLANYSGNVDETTAVGKYPPNAFGLYDMHGNVWEWCQDDWHGDYKNAPTDGSAWVSGENSTKVLRGGSWVNLPGYCRSASRYFYYFRRVYRIDFVGFRVVCGFGRT